MADDWDFRQMYELEVERAQAEITQQAAIHHRATYLLIQKMHERISEQDKEITRMKLTIGKFQIEHDRNQKVIEKMRTWAVRKGAEL